MNTSSRRYAAEAIGTFFLVLIGPGAVAVNARFDGAIGVAGIALAFAFVIIAMVFALGHLSGAHLNPAVTLGFWSVRRFPGRDVAPYVLAQLAGAVGAAAVLRLILANAGSLGATIPAIPAAHALLVEFLLSFALMLVIMAVATDARVTDGFAPIAVGLTVGFCAMVGGPMTGASMNPARSLGPALLSGAWTLHWIYWLAPFTGAVAAAKSYEWLRAASVPPRQSAPAMGLQGPIDR